MPAPQRCTNTPEANSPQAHASRNMQPAMQRRHSNWKCHVASSARGRKVPKSDALNEGGGHFKLRLPGAVALGPI